MTRAVVYSHDTYGLGNIRRMLSISRHLIEHIPDLSILLITGSPMIHGFRLPQRLDYIKLPCLGRTQREKYSSKYLKVGDREIMRLRSMLIRDAVTAFEPDVLLVDKKPYGINNELSGVLERLRLEHPHTQHLLILRDIIDGPEATVKVWKERNYFKAIDLYDQILVLGLPEVFDACREYRFPPHAAGKVRFCGYTRREGAVKDRAEVRSEIGAAEGEKLVLVTTGGGEDGALLLKTYLACEPRLRTERGIRTLIIDGPEIPAQQREEVEREAAANPHITLLNFTDDMLSYMNAADAVVSMGGYNTVCEILTLAKRAVVVPRTFPVEEQRIRAERMTRLGLFKMICPDQLNAETLARAVLSELDCGVQSPEARLDLDALPRIAEHVRSALSAAEAMRRSLTAVRIAPARDLVPPALPPDHVGAPVPEAF